MVKGLDVDVHDVKEKIQKKRQPTSTHHQAVAEDNM
jgi:hypothetical protein